MSDEVKQVTVMIQGTRTDVSNWGSLESGCYAVVRGAETIYRGVVLRTALSEARRLADQLKTMVQILPGRFEAPPHAELSIATPGNKALLLHPSSDQMDRLINGTTLPFEPLRVVLNSAKGVLWNHPIGTVTDEHSIGYCAQLPDPENAGFGKVLVSGADGKLYELRLQYRLEATTLAEQSLDGRVCGVCGEMFIYESVGALTAGSEARSAHLVGHADGVANLGPDEHAEFMTVIP